MQGGPPPAPPAAPRKEWTGKTIYLNFSSIFGDFFLNFSILSWFSQNCPHWFCIISWPIGRPPAERRGVQGGDPPAKAKLLLLKYFLKKSNYYFLYCSCSFHGLQLAANTENVTTIMLLQKRQLQGFHYPKSHYPSLWLKYAQVEEYLARY